MAREQVCWVCGCTNERGCPEGCWWVERDLCSSCSAEVLPAIGYAAALHDAGVGSWSVVADLVRRAGLGDWDFRKLADAACAWSRKHVSPSVRAALKKLRQERAR